MEDVPVLLASSTGLPRKRAHWPTESLAPSSQSTGLGPWEWPQSAPGPGPVAWLRLA